MDSFLLHSLLLSWAALDLDGLGWPGEVTGLESVNTCGPDLHLGSCSLQLTTT